MKSVLALVAVALSGAALEAQVSYVTPLGAEFFEGNSSSGISFGFNNVNTQSRIQNIDINLVGKSLRLIRSIAWRRDNRAAATAVARTADVTILMAHGDFNAMTNVFANNYKTSPVTVFTTKQVNLPDWTAAPPSPPADFDLVLPFDVPFLYNIQDGLLWEIVVQNLSNPNYYYKDFLRSVPHAYGDYATELAPGCTTANGVMALSCGVRVNVATLEVVCKVERAPANGPVVLVIGATDPNLSIPGLCTSLHSDMLLMLLLGSADGGGKVPLKVPLAIPWNAAFAGLSLFNQALALDPSQPGLPFALSNALRCPMPLGSTATPVNVKRTYSTSNATATTGSTPEISAVVTRFGF